MCVLWRFATAWYDSARFRTARLSSARFAFPLQFSTALEWAGLFICRYSCAASTAVTPEKHFNSASLTLSLDPLLGYQREERLYFLNRPRNSHFWLLKERCAHSKQLRSILRWLCLFKSSGSVVSRAASSMTQAVTIFSGQSVISRVYTSRFGSDTSRLEPRPRWY